MIRGRQAARNECKDGKPKNYAGDVPVAEHVRTDHSAATNGFANHPNGGCSNHSRAVAVGTAHEPVRSALTRRWLYVFAVNAQGWRAEELQTLRYFGAVHLDEIQRGSDRL
ncbi:MAG TPA: hypothetical protein VGG51_04390 [Candidatus Cybelea sp.]